MNQLKRAKEIWKATRENVAELWPIERIVRHIKKADDQAEKFKRFENDTPPKKKYYDDPKVYHTPKCKKTFLDYDMMMNIVFVIVAISIIKFVFIK